LSSSTRENLNTRVQNKNQSTSLSIKRKISGKSTLKLNFDYTDNHQALEQINERNDRYRRYSIEYEKSLNSQLMVKLGLSYLNRSSTLQSFNYDEERIYLNISKGF